MDSFTNNAPAQQQAPNFQQPFLLAGPEAEETNNFDFWGVLNRRKWLVFLGLITGMALGSVFHAKSETVYERRECLDRTQKAVDRSDDRHRRNLT